MLISTTTAHFAIQPFAISQLREAESLDADDAYKRVFWSYYTSSAETALIYFIVVIAFLKVP